MKFCTRWMSIMYNSSILIYLAVRIKNKASMASCHCHFFSILPHWPQWLSQEPLLSSVAPAPQGLLVGSEAAASLAQTFPSSEQGWAHQSPAAPKISH